MDMLKNWWPLLVLALLVVVVVRRLRGEPLDLKDAVATPAILLLIGGHTIAETHPTPTDLTWLVILSAISVGFGAARSATTIIERRDEVFVQRYRWKTFALLLASLLVSAGAGLVAQRFGMHEEARPMIFTIGLGLAGEGAITLIRAARLGVPLPWSEAAPAHQGARERGWR